MQYESEASFSASDYYRDFLTLAGVLGEDVWSSKQAAITLWKCAHRRLKLVSSDGIYVMPFCRGSISNMAFWKVDVSREAPKGGVEGPFVNIIAISSF